MPVQKGRVNGRGSLVAMGRRALSGLAATLAVVGGIVACAQLAGIGDTPPTTLACGALLGDGGCQTCGVAECCLEMEACAKSPSCQTLQTCLSACSGDPGCRAACNRDHPISNDPALAALTACLASHCDTACGPACGWVADYTTPDAALGCQQCVIAKACQAIDTCFISPVCGSAAYCVNNSVAFDVNEACHALVDAGDFAASAAAQISQCATECEVNRDWSCIGHVNWPSAVVDASATTVQLVDIITKAPVPGVTVKLCPASDSTCNLVQDTQTTDSNGKATVTVPMYGGKGPTGYIDVSNDAGMYPELFFWSFTLSEPAFAGTIPTSTQDRVALLGALLGADGGFDDTKGHAFLLAWDCRTSAAADVEFSFGPTADPEIQLLYAQSGNLSKTATRTDTSGFALAFNLPVGPVTVTATPVGLGVPSSQVTFYVRPKTLSYVWVPPTPSIQ
jgi:hypothetical protein